MNSNIHTNKCELCGDSHLPGSGHVIGGNICRGRILANQISDLTAENIFLQAQVLNNAQTFKEIRKALFTHKDKPSILLIQSIQLILDSIQVES